jgi:hypothetical protein
LLMFPTTDFATSNCWAVIGWITLLSIKFKTHLLHSVLTHLSSFVLNPSYNLTNKRT